MKSILFIVPLPPPVHGSSMMCDYIRKSRHINGEFNSDFVNLSTSRTMDEIGKAGVAKYVRMLSSFFKTFRKLMVRKYDICYLAITCHGAGFLKDAPFVLLCKAFGKRIVIHQHNKGMAADAGKPLFRWLLKKVYKNAEVILLSERLYPDISSIVSKGQVSVCPNGIPEEPTLLRDKRETSEDKVRILFLSNLIPSKGVLVTLDALKLLKERGYDFVCNFVGGETAELSAVQFNSEISRCGLNGYACYLGRKYGEEKNVIFRESDIFVFPTFYSNECFPVVLLEAMQAGLPCVSTDEGAIPDIIEDGDTGFICRREDPEDTAEKLARLIEDPSLRKRQGEAGRKRFLENFTTTRFEVNLSSILQNIYCEIDSKSEDLLF